MGRAWRAYHPGLPREPGATVSLSRDEAHHLRRVLRLGAGADVHVFDGAGNEWAAIVVSATGAEVVVRLVEPRDDAVEPPFALTLHQAWCRAEHADWIVQKTTELGVAAIRLFLAERSPVSPPNTARLERLRRIAIEACKQSGRRRVPAIDLLDDLPKAPPGTPAWVADPDPGATMLAAALRTASPGPLALAIGPEGGLTGGERTRSEDLGWVPVRLGARILRAETAAVAAAAIVLHAWDDAVR